jgi:hypothetical protein
MEVDAELARRIEEQARPFILLEETARSSRMAEEKADELRQRISILKTVVHGSWSVFNRPRTLTSNLEPLNP